MSITACLVLFAVAVQAAGKAADDPRVSIEPRAKPAAPSDIRVDTNLVLIPVSVTDRKNHPVVGIDARQFRVFDGKAEQQVLNVSSDETPVSVGIVFDASGSMANKLPKARDAVGEFLKSANPDDEFFLVNFAATPELSVPFTTNGGEIRNRLMYATSQGKTALLDAVHLALESMKDARNPRKALLVISDGGDNDSRFTETEIRRMVRETGVWIYAIGIYAGPSAVLPEEERGGPKLLTDLAEETGGRHFAVHSASELPGAAVKIALELRNQYLLGYRPTNVEPDGKYHKVQVKLVDSGDLQLTWRPGYYAPLQ
jgi:VWFA-related protein